MKRNVDQLNEEYVGLKSSEKIMTDNLAEVNLIIEDKRLSPREKMSKILQLFENKNTSQKQYSTDYTSDMTILCKGHLKCLSDITEYKESLELFSKDSSNRNANWKKVLTASENLKKHYSQHRINLDNFFNKHNLLVDSDDKMNRGILFGLKNDIEGIIKRENELKNEAKILTKDKGKIEINAGDDIQEPETLPNKILVGRIPTEVSKVQLLRDIGYDENFKELNLNIKEQGNVIIRTAFEEMSDSKIDEFVVAYVYRFMEAFPNAALNIHIFDDNTNILYKRMLSGFKRENSSEITKKILKIHTSLEDLNEIRDVICEDIFQKTTVDKPDLYAIYQEDKTDPFNLIVLRDGFLDRSGHASNELLDTIYTLTNKDGVGHRCGLRFLIIDNSESFEGKMLDNTRLQTSQIIENFEYAIGYSKGEFSINKNKIKMVYINGNIEVFIQNRTDRIVNEINMKNRSVVSFDDLQIEEGTRDVNNNILYIPIGKAGGKQVELPFSCKDVGGTSEGSCIGYMVIGQSGSGKSSFFHSLVLNGCRKYTPDELQFWLLDFKNGGASSKYRDSGIPHIKIIAENNKIDDALCLFQMILEEMERRAKIFNDNFTDNISDYNNKFGKKEGYEYFPRIIIAIDEIQEIFRDDKASTIQSYIAQISTRMRSSGMHFVMVAQNLKDGKAYMLKEAFMPNITGRVCFRVAQDIPNESGFEEEFVQRRQEIGELKTGEAYVSYGRDTIKKVKMAFVSTDEMGTKLFDEICRKHNTFNYLRPRIIGSKQRLTLVSKIQGQEYDYSSLLMRTTKNNFGTYESIIGEDSYRMIPHKVQFSQNDNSSVLLLGNDRMVASSLCTSIAIALSNQKVKTYIFNADRSRIQNDVGAIPHPFMYYCQNAVENNGYVIYNRLEKFKDIIAELYEIFLERQIEIQKAEYEDPVFEPLFLIVNDLFAIESFSSRETISNNTGNKNSGFDDLSDSELDFGSEYKMHSIFGDDTSDDQENDKKYFSENIQWIMSQILRNGYRYNIHMILAIKGDPSTWNSLEISSELRNVVLFNSTEFADSRIENSYYVKEMLKNISNESEGETMAVWYSKRKLSKLRPIIYDLSNEKEKQEIDKLLKETSHEKAL